MIQSGGWAPSEAFSKPSYGKSRGLWCGNCFSPSAATTLLCDAYIRVTSDPEPCSYEATFYARPRVQVA